MKLRGTRTLGTLELHDYAYFPLLLPLAPSMRFCLLVKVTIALWLCSASIKRSFMRRRSLRGWQ